MKCLVLPHPPGRGGPGTFQRHLEKSLKAHGWSALPYGQLNGADSLLVVLGTRKVGLLVHAKLRKIRIVHRLDGVNWEHREKGRSLKVKLVWGLRNWLMATTRRYFADVVIYQSEFIKQSWDRFYGTVKCKQHIIYNGTDTDYFHPREGGERHEGLRLLCVEGGVKVNDNLVELLEELSFRFIGSGKLSTIQIAGRINASGRERLDGIHGVELLGEVDREDMPRLYRSADLFLCLELNPPCPNSVVEAMASGLPIVGYDTGALGELAGDAASLANYGGDPWEFEPGDLGELCRALNRAMNNRAYLSNAARERAVACLDKEGMVAKYIAALN